MVDFLVEKMRLETKTEALRLYVMFKCFEEGHHLSEADVNSLVELYETGYNDDFFKNCVDKGFFKSKQTVSNAVTRMTKMGILHAPKRKIRVINPSFVPETKANKLMVQYLVGNV
jgi:hypothetical protein